jgi:ComF family protein
MVLWRPLGGLMVGALQNGASAIDVETIDVVSAVPLHESRLKERGFNQSELLAEAVAEAAGKPLKRLLGKTRATLPQVDLPRQSRSANVRGAFEPRLQEVIAGERILLIDDLFTTGATLSECARALRRAEAREVRAFTLARGIPQWRRAAAALAASDRRG